jgi:hypothetical protein
MWGIRAIRVGVLLGGLLATVAGCSSLNPTLPLIPSPDQSITPRNLGSQEDSSDSKSGTDEVQTRRKPNWRHPHCPWWDEDAKKTESHLTPERIHGGIY